MARLFDGSDDELNTTIGLFASQDGGPCTIAILGKRNAGGSTTGEWVGLHTSAGDPAGVIGRLDGADNLRYSTDAGDQSSAFTWLASENWCVIAASKANGSATPRFHKYVVTSATWTHSNAAAALGDSTGTLPGATGRVRFGGGAGGFGGAWSGTLALVAIWNRVLTDVEVEQLEGSLQGWISTSPDGLWLLDQAATSQNVIDTTGNGANQVAITGTALEDGAPGFTYGAPVVRVQRVVFAGQTIAIGQATETDTAQALTRVKTLTLGQVTETDASRVLTAVKQVALGVVTESDAARALAVLKTRVVGMATEVDESRAIAWAPKARLVGQVTETDLAQAISTIKIVALGQATETDLAQAITSRKTVALGQATETDLARALGAAIVVAVGQATETDTSRAIAAVKTAVVGMALETDTARILGRAIGLGRATETDAAQAITSRKTLALGQAIEVDSARAITWAPKARLITAALESNLAQSITSTKVVILNRASSTETAQVIQSAKVAQLGRVIESNTAQVITWAPKIVAVLRAIEIDTALSITIVAGAGKPGRVDLSTSGLGSVSLTADRLGSVDLTTE